MGKGVYGAIAIGKISFFRKSNASVQRMGIYELSVSSGFVLSVRDAVRNIDLSK